MTYEITGEQQAGGFILPQELEVIERLPEAPVVIDVGANVGDFTQAVLERRPKATVLAFEPQDEAVRRFRDRFPEDPRVRLYPLAVSNDNVSRELFTAEPGSQLATFFPRAQMPEIKLHSLGLVPTITLAKALDESHFNHVDLLKIDAEGAEMDVLRGAVPILSNVDMVLWELILGETAYTDDTPETFETLLDRFEVESLSPEGHAGMYLYLALTKRKWHPARPTGEAEPDRAARP